MASALGNLQEGTSTQPTLAAQVEARVNKRTTTDTTCVALTERNQRRASHQEECIHTAAIRAEAGNGRRKHHPLIPATCCLKVARSMPAPLIRPEQEGRGTLTANVIPLRPTRMHGHTLPTWAHPHPLPLLLHTYCHSQSTSYTCTAHCVPRVGHVSHSMPGKSCEKHLMLTFYAG
jgi:hypothetical protein